MVEWNKVHESSTSSVTWHGRTSNEEAEGSWEQVGEAESPKYESPDVEKIESAGVGDEQGTEWSDSNVIETVMIRPTAEHILEGSRLLDRNVNVGSEGRYNRVAEGKWEKESSPIGNAGYEEPQQVQQLEAKKECDCERRATWLREQSLELNDRMHVLDGVEKLLHAREKDLNEREMVHEFEKSIDYERLEATRTELNERENGLNEKEKVLMEFEKILNDREQLLINVEKEYTELMEREEALNKREKDLDEKQKARKVRDEADASRPGPPPARKAPPPPPREGSAAASSDGPRPTWTTVDIAPAQPQLPPPPINIHVPAPPQQVQDAIAERTYPYGWTITTQIGFAFVPANMLVMTSWFVNLVKEMLVEQGLVVMTETDNMWYTYTTVGKVTFGVVSGTSKSHYMKNIRAPARIFMRGINGDNKHSFEMQHIMTNVKKLVDANAKFI